MTYRYRVNQLIPLSERVMRVFLEPCTEQQVDYQAGQYVEIELSTGERRPYSIANAPLGARQLEFHIRHVPDDPYAQQLLSDLRSSQEFALHGPLGACTFRPTKKPVLMIAGGTGFAPIKAIIEEILAVGEPPKIHLFWGASSESDLYLDAIPIQWQQHVQSFQYTPVLSKPNNPASWSGKTGYLAETLQAHYPQLSDYQAYVQGPFQLALALQQALCQLGLAESEIFSDAFTTK